MRAMCQLLDVDVDDALDDEGTGRDHRRGDHEQDLAGRRS